MPVKNLFAAIQDQLDTMSQALNDCVDGDINEHEMWGEIETAIQALSQMAMGAAGDDEEDDDADEDEDGVIELNFGDDAEQGEADDEDDEGALQ